MNASYTHREARARRDEDASFLALVGTLRDGKWSIATATCGALLAGVIYSIVAPPVYQAEILVQVIESGDTATARSLLGEIYTLFDAKSTAGAETQILASRLVVSRAVDALHLFIDARPDRFPIVGDWIARRSDGLSPPAATPKGRFAWGQERIDVPTFDIPDTYLDQRFTLANLGSGRYRLTGPALHLPVDGTVGRLERIAVPGGVIALQVDSIDAQAGVHFTLVRHSRAATIERLRKNLRVMEKVKQSDVIVATLRNPDPDVASRVLNEIGRQYLAQNVEQRSLEAARSLAFLELQEPLLKARLTESEARLTALRNEQGSIDLVEEAKLALAHSANASTHLVELRQRREALLARYTPSHPDVLATERQIALFEQERALADNKVRGLPDLQQQVLRRMLDVKVNTDLYTALLNNMQQLQLIRAGRIGNVRVVDSATPPEEPVGPRNTLIVIASLVFGVVFGSGYVMVRSMLSRRIVDPREIERHLGMRVLIGIPFDPVTRDRPRPRAESAAIGPSPETDDTPAIEQLRTLRILLDHARRDAANDIVVITSASASAGTSFVAGELARVYGAAGSRVLLIDGDTREGRLSRKYGQAHAPGLMEILAAGRAPDEIAIRDITPGVDFLAAGTTQGYAADRLTSPPVWDGIGTYATRYDAVFVATCPVLSGPDAAAFARVAGTTLLVVRAARTTLEQAGEALDRLTASGARVDGIVVNGVGPRAASRRARRQP